MINYGAACNLETWYNFLCREWALLYLHTEA